MFCSPQECLGHRQTDKQRRAQESPGESRRPGEPRTAQESPENVSFYEVKLQVCFGNAHFYEVRLSVEPFQEEGVERRRR